MPTVPNDFGELDEIGVVQVGLVGAGKEIVQVPGHVAVGVVTEDDGYDVDAVLDGGGKLGGVKHKAPVAGHADDGPVGLGHLRAQGRREAVAQVEGIAGIDIGLGVIHLVVGAGVKAELGYVPDDEGIFRDGALDALQDGVLGFLQSDVVVGDDTPSGDDRIVGRGTVSRVGFGEVGEQGFDGGFGVAVERDGVGLAW